MGVFFSSFFFNEYPYYYSEITSFDYANAYGDFFTLNLSLSNKSFYYFKDMEESSIGFANLISFGYSEVPFYSSYFGEYVPNHYLTLDIFKEIEHWDMKDEDLLPMDGNSYYPINNFYWLSPFLDYFLEYNKVSNIKYSLEFYNYSAFFGNYNFLENNHDKYFIFSLDDNFMYTRYIGFLFSPLTFVSSFFSDIYLFFTGRLGYDHLFDLNFLVQRGYLVSNFSKEDLGIDFFYSNHIIFNNIAKQEIKLFEKGTAYSFFHAINFTKSFSNVDSDVLLYVMNIPKINTHSYNFFGSDVSNGMSQNLNLHYSFLKKYNNNLGFINSLSKIDNIYLDSVYKHLEILYLDNFMLNKGFLLINSNDFFGSFSYPKILNKQI